MTEEVDEGDAPSNTVMKILIGVVLFVFVGIPLIAIAIIVGLIAIGNSLNSTFETVEMEMNAPAQEQPVQEKLTD